MRSTIEHAYLFTLALKSNKIKRSWNKSTARLLYFIAIILFLTLLQRTVHIHQDSNLTFDQLIQKFDDRYIFCNDKQNERLVTTDEQAQVEWQQTSDTSNDSSPSVDKHAWIQGDVLAGFSFCGGQSTSCAWQQSPLTISWSPSQTV